MSGVACCRRDAGISQGGYGHGNRNGLAAQYQQRRAWLKIDGGVSGENGLAWHRFHNVGGENAGMALISANVGGRAGADGRMARQRSHQRFASPRAGHLPAYQVASSYGSLGSSVASVSSMA
jgi:hypothetical protein